ncbi:unnamed protein product [Adineta steineri]|uniref:Uncharacterized protein n=1 Tax=Adineta steineri TaxID=433720 RepID=A0A814Q9D7_9BILA|nr:unnamed protein product [Adineta steineri]
MGILETAGILAIICILARLGVFIYELLCPKLIDVKTLGQWALVTGSTDGIGKAYAHQLAKRGLNIVLISRTKERLEEVAKEIQNKYSNIQVKTIPIDFTSKFYI